MKKQRIVVVTPLGAIEGDWSTCSDDESDREVAKAIELCKQDLNYLEVKVTGTKTVDAVIIKKETLANSIIRIEVVDVV